MPTISVIVPFFNSAPYIDALVRSLKDQSFGDFEAIIVDDGSTDGGAERLAQAIACLENVLVMQGRHAGPAAARNLGLDRARGEFLFFLDADDSLEPFALEHLIGIARMQAADWVIGGYRKVKLGSLDYGRTIAGVEPGLLTHEAVLAIGLGYLRAPNGNQIFNNVWGRLYRRAPIAEHGVRFNEAAFVGEDLEFNYNFLRYATKIWYDERVIYNYTVSTTLSSASMHKGVDSILATRAMECISVFLREAGIASEIVKEAASQGRTVLAIIGVVRVATAAGSIGIEQTVRRIADIADHPALRESLPQYRPGASGSRWIPRFLALRWVLAAFLLGWCKGVRRYGLRACLGLQRK